MSTQYNVNGIADQSLVWDETTNTMVPKTWALILTAKAVGVPEITEATAAELYRRFLIYERMVGQIWLSADSPMTLADVRARIGLKTNATPLSNAKFKSSCWQVMQSEIARKIDLESA